MKDVARLLAKKAVRTEGSQSLLWEQVASQWINSLQAVKTCWKMMRLQYQGWD